MEKTAEILSSIMEIISVIQLAAPLGISAMGHFDLLQTLLEERRAMTDVERDALTDKKALYRRRLRRPRPEGAVA